MELLSDNALMVSVREGDLDKLSLLFEKYKRPLYGFFYGLTRKQEVSEDLVQNTFLRILKYRHLFRGDGDFRAWMFHIARNVNNDHFRKNKILAEDVDRWHDKLGTEENRATQIQMEEQEQLLAQAMSRLPADKREILLLSKYQEKKYSDIGNMLGCTESAVKVKVFRALQELKTIYRQLEKIN